MKHASPEIASVQGGTLRTRREWGAVYCCVDVFWLNGRLSVNRLEMFYAFIYLSYIWAHILPVFAFLKKIDHGMIICQVNKQGSPLCYGLGMAVRSFLLLFDSVIVTTCYPYLTQRFKSLNLVLPWNSLWSVSLEPSDIRGHFLPFPQLLSFHSLKGQERVGVNCHSS